MKLSLNIDVELSEEEIKFINGENYNDDEISFLELEVKGLIAFDNVGDPYTTVLGDIVRHKLKNELRK